MIYMTNDDHQKIVLFIFAGRQKYMDLQTPYLSKILRSFPASELHIWNFSRNDHDNAYLQSLPENLPRTRVFNEYYAGRNEITTCTKSIGVICSCTKCRVGHWSEPYKYYASRDGEEKTIYVKIDDDILYQPTYDDIESVYSYNFDAIKFAEVIKNKVCIPNGVKFVEGQLKQVKLNDFGFIQDIKLWDQQKFKADLYIDCSGFKGALIEAVMNEPFVSFSDSLFCDTAIAAPIPYKDKKTEMEPYSRLYTMNSGWLWKTPIYDRIGSGYVYSSKHISDEDAEKEFREFHDGYDGKVMKINMRIGTRERVAVKNVVACGLAGGFAEPMESTGISTFQGIMATLATELEKNNLNYTSQTIDEINKDNIDMMIDIRDFIQAHYLMCNRNDTQFWKDVHNKTFVPDTLRQKIQVMSIKPPDQLFRGRIFGGVNWFQWLWAMGLYKKHPFKLEEKYEKLCDLKMEVIKKESEELVKIFPNHYEYLKNLYGRD